MTDRLLDASDFPFGAAQLILMTGPFQQVADVHAQVTEQFTPFFVDGICGLDLLVEFFEQLAEFIVFHERPPSSERYPESESIFIILYGSTSITVLPNSAGIGEKISLLRRFVYVMSFDLGTIGASVARSPIALTGTPGGAFAGIGGRRAIFIAGRS